MGKKIIIAKILIITVVCLLLVTQNAICVSSGKAENKWNWFSAFSVYNDWTIHRGMADVMIKPGKLKAELYDEYGNTLYTITGSIDNDQVKAVVIEHGTDAEQMKMTGMIHKFNRSTSILLYEKFAGGTVIGITITKEEEKQKR